MLDGIERDVRFEGPLSVELHSRLLEIANKCPVHRTLTSKINIRTKIV
jgi:putative redox protein